MFQLTYSSDVIINIKYLVNNAYPGFDRGRKIWDISRRIVLLRFSEISPKKVEENVRKYRDFFS